MTTTEIREKINNEFTAIYKNATSFVNSGKLWDFCMETVSDATMLNCIIFANDMEVPPVKSMLVFYERKMGTYPSGLDMTTKQSVGAFWGFVFKYCLGYQGQKERCAVNLGGIKSATRYIDGAKILVEQ